MHHQRNSPRQIADCHEEAAPLEIRLNFRVPLQEVLPFLLLRLFGLCTKVQTEIKPARMIEWAVDPVYSIGEHRGTMIALLLFLLPAVVFPSPVPDKRDNVKYDQRQEGEFNLRADLENFVILLIPTSPSATPNPPSSSSPSSINLLDLLSKSIIPMKPHHGKRNKHVKKDGSDLRDPAEETMHFIESKTAPYHVDISKSREELSKLHPQPDDVLVAQSPTVSLLKNADQESRVSKAVIIALPLEGVDKKGVPKKDGKKKHPKEIDGETLKLLGAENEQCGPGLRRDAEGICRIVEV